MGCWNSTCGISNLPIFAGEKVRGLLITGVYYHMDIPSMVGPDSYGEKSAYREGWWNGYCYHHDIFAPRCIPMRGVYNDYGGIEKIVDGLNTKIIVDQFNLDLIETKAGKYDFPPEIKKGMALSEFLNALSDNAVSVWSHGMKNKPVPVGLWMVREDIYQTMINSGVRENFMGKPITRGSVMEEAKKAIANIVDQVNRGIDFKKAAELVENNKTQDEIMDLSRLLFRFSMDLEMTAFGAFLTGNRTMNNNPSYYLQWIMDHLDDGSLDNTSKEFNTLLGEMVDFAVFNAAMQYMRKGYMPQPGSGSQDSDMKVHVAVAKKVIQIYKADRKERNRDDRAYKRYLKAEAAKKPKAKKSPEVIA